MAAPHYAPRSEPEDQHSLSLNRTAHLVVLEVDRPVIWIRSFVEAEQFRFNEKASLCGRIHFDTETGGIKALEEPLNARPALAQFNLPEVRSESGKIVQRAHVVIFDLKLLEEDAKHYFRREGIRRNPFEPFRAALEDPKIQKIIQQATFERELCKRYGVSIENVRDTKLVAKLVRPDLANCLTLQALCAEVCGLWMDKGPQTSDWLQRPLAKEERNYAALDVIALEVLDNTLLRLEQMASIKEHLPLPALLDDLRSTYEERVRLGRTVIGRWQECCREQHLLKQKARELAVGELKLLERHGLVDTSIHWQGACGSTTAWRSLRREFSLSRFQKLHPEAANLLLGHHVSQSALRSFLAAELPSPEYSSRERGFLFRRILKQSYASPTVIIDADFEGLYGITGEDILDGEKNLLGEQSLFSNDTVAEIRLIAHELRPDLNTQSITSLCREIIGVKLRPLDSTNPFKVMRDEAFNSEAVSQLRRYLRETSIKISGRVHYLTPDDPEVITRRMVELEQEKRALWGQAGLGNSYWPLFAREAALRRAIERRLLETIENLPPCHETKVVRYKGAKEGGLIPQETEEHILKPLFYEERHGVMRASVEQKVHRNVDIEALTAIFPEEATSLITTKAPDARALHNYFTSKGIHGREQQALFDEFMHLLGWEPEPSASANAKYKLLYAETPAELDDAG